MKNNNESTPTSNESIPAFDEKKSQKLEAFDTAESNESTPTSNESILAFDEKKSQKLEAFDTAESNESIPISNESIPAFDEKKSQKLEAFDTLGSFLDPDSDLTIRQGRLPHWEQKNVWYFVTFRLADSIPEKVAENLKIEREIWLKKHPEKNLTIKEKKEYYQLFSGKIEALLAAGYGSCVLKNEKAARIVVDALMFFNHKRYILDEWVVMPNHVHVLLLPLENYSLADILHSWKSFTANKINKLLGQKGRLWLHESYDHLVRNEEAMVAFRYYIRKNPEKAGISIPDFCRSTPKSNESILAFDVKKSQKLEAFDPAESNESILAFDVKEAQKLEAFDTAESNESIPVFDVKEGQKLEAFDTAESNESIPAFDEKEERNERE
jgi:REP element-mobilizing transposase RayT